MSSGKILTTELKNIPVLKFVGDVRVLMSSTLDNYFGSLYQKAVLDAMLIDMSDTKGIDSTALGLLAKMAIQLRNRFNVEPTIISPNPDITKILKSMSFDLIFTIVDTATDEPLDYSELNQTIETEESVREKVISAHQTLMSLSEDNRLEFHDLVQSLKNQS